MYMRRAKKNSIKNSIKNKKLGKTRRIKRRIRTRKNIGGSQEVYLTIQPSALSIRDEREWENKKYIDNDEKPITRPVVSKLVSKISIINSPSIDIDEKMAEMIESIKNTDKVVRPIYSKMMTSEIINKDMIKRKTNQKI